MPIRLIDIIKPQNDGYFPIVEDSEIYGGYHSVIDLTTRDNIPDLRRKIGMAVYVQSESKLYTLNSDLVNWTEFSGSGGAGSGFIIYRPGEPTPTGNVYSTWTDAMSARSVIPAPSTE